MGLTPVRVRGKRKAASAKPPKALREQRQHPARKTKRSLSTVMATRGSKYRPNLDTLPAEILEIVLFYSSNLSLPRSSPIIGLRLSSRATLIRLLFWAFHETWNQWFGLPASKCSTPRPQVPSMQDTECKGDYGLQTVMLKQPWVTIDMILQAQQSWAKRYAHGRCYQHSVPWVDKPDELGHSQYGDPSHFNAQECFDIDFEQAMKWGPFEFESTPWGGQDIHPLTRIPERLITGPWSEEQRRRLFWLARGGLVVGHDEFYMPPWEMKLEFLHNAVLDVTQPDLIAINCLMGRWVFQGLPGDVVRLELSNIDKRLRWGDDTDIMRRILRWTKDVLWVSAG